MEENDRAHAVSRLCRKGCGFFGNPNFDGLCSKCHRDMQITAEKVHSAARLSSPLEKSFNEDEPNTSEENISAQLDHITSSLTDLVPSNSKISTRIKCDDQFPTDDTSVTVDSDAARSPARLPNSSDGAPKKILRCLFCNKRVGLTGFTCRCGGLFCTVHRYSDCHDCSFDYRQLGQSDIRKSNPQVICSKVNKF